jgi:hypothetical protein
MLLMLDSYAELPKQTIELVGQLFQVLAGRARLFGSLGGVVGQCCRLRDVLIDVFHHVGLLQGGAGDRGVAGPAAGVTLYLNAIQLVNFVEYSGGAFTDGDIEFGGWTGEEGTEFDEASSGAPVDSPKVRL